MSSRARIGIVVGAVVILVVAFVIASSSGDDDNDKTSASTQQTTAAVTGEQGGATATTPAQTTSTATTPAEPAIAVVTVKDAKPVGGIKKIKFTKGDTIRFKVVSDTADEIHFHGYDIGQDVKAGGSTTFTTKATIEGRFIVELEDHEQQIAEVEVDPS
jgi:mannitol-specific phosphotransferase system IIBC component